MTGCSAENVPAWLQRTMAAYPADAKAKLAELYVKFKFDSDQLECFAANHGDVVKADKVPEFQRMLEAEMAVKSAPSAPPKGAATKRALDHTSFLGSASVGSLLAVAGVRVPSERDSEVVSPAPKRAREVGDVKTPKSEGPRPPQDTPENPPRPSLQVSLTKSLNSGNLSKTPTGATRAPVSVELLGDRQLWSGRRKGGYVWMDEALEDRAASRELRLTACEAKIAKAMLDRHPSEEVAVGVVGMPTQQETVLVGRIVCEGLDGKLNERSILLEGSRASSKGARVQLNVAECPQIAAFPGQIVGVLGRSGMAGTTFHARDFIAGLPSDAAPTAAPSTPLHMMVLSGPYCLRDSLDYTPLEQALEHAAREMPQVLVLLGPLMDANNAKVSSGDTTLPNEEEPRSFEEIYSDHVLPLLSRCLAPLRRGSSPTEVLLVPSLDEVMCFHPLPQPPLNVALGDEPALGKALGKLADLGVKFLPNPAHVEINGLRVSITSSDALSPVLRAGLVLRPEQRKIDEALGLLLKQRSLFPVVPRDPPQVSEARAAALDFVDDATPDVCIFPAVSGTPSGTFVDSTLFVNPGPLCRPAVLGSFAELWVTPAADKGKNPAHLRDRARIDIQKLN